MKTFTSIEEAFHWWLQTIYPNLPPETKKGRLTTAWRDYTHKLGISEKRMLDILKEQGSVEVKTVVKFKPK
jgi:hypothetical protein